MWSGGRRRWRGWSRGRRRGICSLDVLRPSPVTLLSKTSVSLTRRHFANRSSAARLLIVCCDVVFCACANIDRRIDEREEEERKKTTERRTGNKKNAVKSEQPMGRRARTPLFQYKESRNRSGATQMKRSLSMKIQPTACRTE